MKHILKCKSCQTYTMKDVCPKCDKKTSPTIPPKYSPHDKYAKYRRETLEEERKKADLI